VHRTAQLAACEAEVVLLCGNVALSQWRSDVSIGTCYGIPFTKGERVFIPSIHPAAVLRDSGQQWKLDHAVGVMAMIVTGEGIEGRNLLGTHCLGCNRPFERYDKDCWPWCKRHGPKELTEKQRVKKLTRARTEKNTRRQVDLFDGAEYQQEEETF
jgi:hypothetical protein